MFYYIVPRGFVVDEVRSVARGFCRIGEFIAKGFCRTNTRLRNVFFVWSHNDVSVDNAIGTEHRDLQSWYITSRIAMRCPDPRTPIHSTTYKEPRRIKYATGLHRTRRCNAHRISTIF